MNILSLEDDEDVREITEMLIASKSRTFFSVGTIEEALKIISKNHIDLIISDFNLGEDTYYDLLNNLKQKNIIIPTVLYSGYQKLDDVFAPPYLIDKLPKPNIDQLLKVVVSFEHSLNSTSRN